MAVSDSLYRIKIDNTYSTAALATTATTAINNVLIAAGRPERASNPTATTVYLMVTGMSYAAATTLHTSLAAAWTATARTGGKVSLVRSNDLD